MAVRNFWIRASIDGRATTLSGGPQSKDGGFDLTVYQRDHGEIVEAVEIRGRTHTFGELVLTVRVGGQELEFVTRR